MIIICTSSLLPRPLRTILTASPATVALHRSQIAPPQPKYTIGELSNSNLQASISFPPVILSFAITIKDMFDRMVIVAKILCLKARRRSEPPSKCNEQGTVPLPMTSVAVPPPFFRDPCVPSYWPCCALLFGHRILLDLAWLPLRARELCLPALSASPRA